MGTGFRWMEGSFSTMMSPRWSDWFLLLFGANDVGHACQGQLRISIDVGHQHKEAIRVPAVEKEMDGFDTEVSGFATTLLRAFRIR
jgi:hypothetical protein